MQVRSFSILLMMILALHANAQTIDSVQVSVQTNIRLVEYLEALEAEHGFRFYYRSAWLENIFLGTELNNMPLLSALTELLQPSGFTFHFLGPQQLVFIKDPRPERERITALRTAQIQQRQIRTIGIGLEEKSHARPGPFRITGSITDQKTEAPVAALSVTVLRTSNSVLTDINGFFSVDLPPGHSILLLDHVNFSPQLLDIEVYQNGTIAVAVEEKPILLSEVVVSGQAVQDRTLGESRIRLSDVKRSTTFMGEADLIKQIQTQPGVAVVGEIATGFHVRGGSVDQNLVLYDGVPVYNPSHALGFFGAFLADGIRETAFYADWQPVEMGGRVSSVLALTSQDGDRHRWHGTGGIGPISAYGSIHGPISKKLSLFSTFRSTYSNWALRALRSRFVDLANARVNFYDGSAKLTAWLSDNTSVSASYYRSEDSFRLTNDTTYGWRNLLASFRVTHQFNARLAGIFQTGFTGYQFELRDEERLEDYRLQYRISQPSLKADFIHEGKHEWRFGVQSTIYQIMPGLFEPGASNVQPRLSIPIETAHESSVYVADHQRWHKWELQAALRFVFFQRLGPGIVNQYTDGQPRDVATLVGATEYETGRVMKTYPALEPRLQLRYRPSPEFTFLGSFQRINQFIHLVTNSAVPNPVDVWQLSNHFFRPQRAMAGSLGAQWIHPAKKWTSRLTGFIKHVDNVLDFKDGSLLLLNPQIETALLPGQLRSGGIEAQLTKETGRLTGQFSYTFARAMRRTPGFSPREAINRGNWYSAHFDMPHLAQLQWRYSISTRHFFTGTFICHTGRPISLPSAFYQVEGIPITQFEERNTYRLRDYHRLDLAFVIEGNYKRKKPWSGTWTISFFNVYARKNPFSAFFVPNALGQLLPRELALVGTIIPTINYALKF
jgi:hypothetical protein